MWLLLIAWTTLLVLGAERVALWNPSMLRDTVLSLVPAGSLLVGAMDSVNTKGWYRARLRRAFELAVFVEVLIGLTSFDVAVEVVLLIVLAFVAMLAALAGTRYDTSGGVVPRWANRVLMVGGVLFIGAPVLYLIQNATTIDWWQLGRQLFQPVWLIALTLPLVYYIGLVGTYDDGMRRLSWWADGKARWWQRLALIVGFNVRPHALNRFIYSVRAMRSLVGTRTFWEAMVVVTSGIPPEPSWDDEDDEEEDDHDDEDDDKEDDEEKPERPAIARHHNAKRPRGRRRSR
jgi:hypothetical protein